MKKSSKAALLSALIFPGVGHLVLKQYLRGSALVLVAFTAFSVAVDRAYQRALTVVDRILAGDVPADTGSIADMVSSSTSGADSIIDCELGAQVISVRAQGKLDLATGASVGLSWPHDSEHWFDAATGQRRDDMR